MPVKEFDQQALAAIPGLRSFASSLCKDAQRIDDLVQETMLKAYRFSSLYQQGSNFRAWLFQICKNTYFNEYRRKHLMPVPVDFQEESYESSRSHDHSEFPSRPDLLRDETDVRAHEAMPGDEVSEALRSIPGQYRIPVILSDIEGHTYDEIAEFMNTPVGTVRSRLHRGRKLLAGMLADYARREGICRRALPLSQEN